jgi:hypothetical protein
MSLDKIKNLVKTLGELLEILLVEKNLMTIKRERAISSADLARLGDCKKIILRVPSDKIKTDFGMTLTLNELETELKSIYFGMPYA